MTSSNPARRGQQRRTRRLGTSKQGETMSLIFVQLRWNDPGPDRYAEIVRAIPQDGDLPPGCLSRQLRRQGGALMATETYDDEMSGGRMDHLVTAMRAAGVEESPQTAMFSMPAIYAVAYRRPARASAVDATPAEATIPQQRGAPAREQVPEGVDASATVGS
jgi:hypothetical protein